MDFINVDFMALPAQEKQKIIYEIDDILDEATKNFTFEQKILVQALFMERYYHFIQRAADRFSLPVPALLRDMEEYLWCYLKGECSIEKLEKFHRASESVIIYLLTDDDDELDKEAWEKYKNDWNNSMSFNLCLDEAASEWSYLFEQIVSKNTYYYYYGLKDTEFMSIMGYYIVTFDLEPVYKKEDTCLTPEEHERHWREIFDSPTFGRIISMLCEDLQTVAGREAFSKEEILELYMQYQNKIIFEEEQIAKIMEKIKQKFIKE